MVPNTISKTSALRFEQLLGERLYTNKEYLGNEMRTFPSLSNPCSPSKGLQGLVLHGIVPSVGRKDRVIEGERITSSRMVSSSVTRPLLPYCSNLVSRN